MLPQENHPDIQTPKISVIVPVYNNQSLLPKTISELSRYFAEQEEDYELVFVDDCSTDKSAQLLKSASIGNSKIRIVTHTKNKGQQIAVATGLLESRGTIAVTVDADLPFPVSELHRCALMAATEAELVLGIRKGKLHRPLWRRCASWLGNLSFGLLFPYRVHDFGCGTGAVRRSVIEKLRLQNGPARIIKLELLRLASSYKETELELNGEKNQVRSSYTLGKLLRLFFMMLASSHSSDTRGH